MTRNSKKYKVMGIPVLYVLVTLTLLALVAFVLPLAVIGGTESTVYAGTMGSQGSIHAVGLDTFTLDSSTLLNTNENSHAMAIEEGFLYVGTGRDPTKIIKYSIPDMTRVAETTLDNSILLWAMSLEINGDELLCSFWFSGSIARFNKYTLELIDYATLVTDPNLEGIRGATSNGPYIFANRVTKDTYKYSWTLKIDSTNLQVLDEIYLSGIDLALVDAGWPTIASDGFVYVAHNEYPAAISRINPNTMVLDDYILMDTGDGMGASDVVREYGNYFYTNGDTNPARVFRITKDLSSWEKIDLSIQRLSMIEIDPVTGMLYGGNMDSEAKIVKVDTNTFTEVGYVTLPTGPAPQIALIAAPPQTTTTTTTTTEPPTTTTVTVTNTETQTQTVTQTGTVTTQTQTVTDTLTQTITTTVEIEPPVWYEDQDLGAWVIGGVLVTLITITMAVSVSARGRKKG